MQFNQIVTKLERLLAELSELSSETASERRSSVMANAESVADRWVQKYLRNHRLNAPRRAEIIRLLRTRAACAIAFANLLPWQEMDVTAETSVRIGEVLMIDLWHQCFRHTLIKHAVMQQELSLAE